MRPRFNKKLYLYWWVGNCNMSMISVPLETETNLRHCEYSNFDERARHNHVCESLPYLFLPLSNL